MTKQFTASEVRRAAECPYVLSKNNDMLHAYADRLEADEKAQPVAYILANNTLVYAPASMRINNGTPLYTHPVPQPQAAEPIYQWRRGTNSDKHYWKDCKNKEDWHYKRNSLPDDVFRIVYAHPSSADAERLAEALRIAKPYVTTHPDVFDFRERDGHVQMIEETLAAHSTQAQPPTDQFDPEHNVLPGDIGTEAQPAFDGVQDVVRAVLSEVEAAISKFPTWPNDPLHAVGVLNEECGELNKAVLQHVYEPHKNHPGDVRKEAIQTAAMALRFIAGLPYYVPAPGAQFRQTTLAAQENTNG